MGGKDLRTAERTRDAPRGGLDVQLSRFGAVEGNVTRRGAELHKTARLGIGQRDASRARSDGHPINSERVDQGDLTGGGLDCDGIGTDLLVGGVTRGCGNAVSARNDGIGNAHIAGVGLGQKRGGRDVVGHRVTRRALDAQLLDHGNVGKRELTGRALDGEAFRREPRDRGIPRGLRDPDVADGDRLGKRDVTRRGLDAYPLGGDNRRKPHVTGRNVDRDLLEGKPLADGYVTRRSIDRQRTVHVLGQIEGDGGGARRDPSYKEGALVLHADRKNAVFDLGDQASALAESPGDAAYAVGRGQDRNVNRIVLGIHLDRVEIVGDHLVVRELARWGTGIQHNERNEQNCREHKQTYGFFHNNISFLCIIGRGESAAQDALCAAQGIQIEVLCP